MIVSEGPFRNWKAVHFGAAAATAWDRVVVQLNGGGTAGSPSIETVWLNGDLMTPVFPLARAGQFIFEDYLSDWGVRFISDSGEERYPKYLRGDGYQKWAESGGRVLSTTFNVELSFVAEYSTVALSVRAPPGFLAEVRGYAGVDMVLKTTSGSSFETVTLEL